MWLCWWWSRVTGRRRCHGSLVGLALEGKVDAVCCVVRTKPDKQHQDSKGWPSRTSCLAAWLPLDNRRHSTAVNGANHLLSTRVSFSFSFSCSSSFFSPPPSGWTIPVLNRELGALRTRNLRPLANKSVRNHRVAGGRCRCRRAEEKVEEKVAKQLPVRCSGKRALIGSFTESNRMPAAGRMLLQLFSFAAKILLLSVGKT